MIPPKTPAVLHEFRWSSSERPEGPGLPERPREVFLIPKILGANQVSSWIDQIMYRVKTLQSFSCVGIGVTIYQISYTVTQPLFLG